MGRDNDSAVVRDDVAAKNSRAELAKIETFIRKHHVITVATVGEPDAITSVGVGNETSGATGLRPWVAHVFYAWSPQLAAFVFTTDYTTRHGAEMAGNKHVAAGIALETRIVGRIQGLQIEGEVRRAGNSAMSENDEIRRAGNDTGPEGNEAAELAVARGAYLKRFPYAVAIGELHLWLLEPRQMKLSDNTLGFGKKLVWNRA